MLEGHWYHENYPYLNSLIEHFAKFSLGKNNLI